MKDLHAEVKALEICHEWLKGMKVHDETSASRQTSYNGLGKEVEEDSSAVAEEWRELIESASVLGRFQFRYFG